MILPGEQAPEIKAQGLMPNGKIIEQNNWIESNKRTILLFYPYDFTFVCPTELLGFSERIKEFEQRNTNVLGISIDSVHSHSAWCRMSLAQGGIGSINFPLIGDDTHEICNAYGVRACNSPAFRAVVFIDEKGIVRHFSINDNMIGRNTDEVLRIIDAFTHFQEHGEVCPLNWRKGQKALKPDVESTSQFLSETYKK